MPVAIGPRALDVLAVLVDRSGELVLKEEIMAAVWGRTVVESANLTVQISTLRRILDKGQLEGSCIQTIAARGYRFVAPVTRLDRETKSESATLAVWRGIGENESAAVLVPDHGSRTTALPDLQPARARRYSAKRGRVALAGVAAIVTTAVLVAAAVWWIRPGRYPLPRQWRQLRLRFGRRARPTYRLSCCPLQILAKAEGSNILPTVLPTI